LNASRSNQRDFGARAASQARLAQAARQGDARGLAEAVAAGADLDSQGKDGALAMEAARSGSAPRLEMLAWAGADLDVKDRLGQSPWSVAKASMAPEALARIQAARDRRELISGLRLQLRLIASLPDAPRAVERRRPGFERPALPADPRVGRARPKTP
jgi:hypothetical protein